MPSIAVFVDGALMARVNSEGLDILTVNVGSTKADETLATIEFSGGKYPDDGDSSHLIWLNELQLSSGQTVRVLVSASGDTTAPGRTLEELYPDLPEEKEGPMPTRSQLIAEVSKRPHFREGYSFTLRSSLVLPWKRPWIQRNMASRPAFCGTGSALNACPHLCTPTLWRS